jgi:hypothetical protein
MNQFRKKPVEIYALGESVTLSAHFNLAEPPRTGPLYFHILNQSATTTHHLVQKSNNLITNLKANNSHGK